jgi:hypothetical protein
MVPIDGQFAERAIVDYRYRLLIKENKLPFSKSGGSKQTEVCRSVLHLQPTNGSCRFPLVPFLFAEFLEHGDMET